MISLADRERPRDRPPKPELQLNLLGTLAATSLALLAYLAALLAHLSLPSAFAVVLLAIAPACAIPATVLLAIRARAEQDEALRAVTAGLVIACVGMVLQLLAFRELSPGGGIFATRGSGKRAAQPDVAPGAAGGCAWCHARPAPVPAPPHRAGRRCRDPARVRRLRIPRSWVVVKDDGSYTAVYVVALVAVILFTIGGRHPLGPAQRAASDRDPRLDHGHDGAVGL